MNSIFNNTARFVWLIAAITFSTNGAAAEQPTGPSNSAEPPSRREPPPQAYEDCKGKQVGDVVQITTPREGKISATCTNSPKGLFARPEHPPRDRNEAGRDAGKDSGRDPNK